MKTLIVALNSKYIHYSPAPWLLKGFCGESCGEIIVKEYNINEDQEKVLQEIIAESNDVTAFSCYIWNILQVGRLCENLKKLRPQMKIILGGPEVSFETEEIHEASPLADFIICGEGELPLQKLLSELQNNYEIETNSEGKNKSNFSTGSAKKMRNSESISNLDRIPSPYTPEMIKDLNNRILYYESSRGCPFSCSYCLSSLSNGVRYYSLERVKRDIKFFFDNGIKQVKFADRTFNCNKERSKDIFRYIIETYKEGFPNLEINFHFEVAGDLFDEESLNILKIAPKGLFQLEIGVQSFNSETIAAVDRICDSEKLTKNVSELLAAGNIHIHLDLIAGLPKEGLKSFAQSFDKVYNLKPHMLQLGFLKFLKGSKIRRQAASSGYSFRSYPPYEILEGPDLNYKELQLLKGVEELVERFYNSGRFTHTLDYIMPSFFKSAFSFYSDMNKWCLNTGVFNTQVSSRDLYMILFNYLRSFSEKCGLNIKHISELMKYDYLSTDRSGNLPEPIKSNTDNEFKEKCKEFLKEKENVFKYLPQYIDEMPGQIARNIRFEEFTGVFNEGGNIYIIDYGLKDRVTGRYSIVQINL